MSTGEQVTTPALDTVGVIGGGTMGAGIAITAIRAGLPTLVFDVSDEAVASARERIVSFLDAGVARGKSTPEQRDAALDQLQLVTDIEAMGAADIVIEAVFEDLGAQGGDVRRARRVCGPETLFHTNTSTLSVTAIAAGSRHPERVVGTHYCNPAPLMRARRGRARAG